MTYNIWLIFIEKILRQISYGNPEQSNHQKDGNYRVLFYFWLHNRKSNTMLALAIGSGANIFILVVVVLIAIITGISTTDILNTKEKEQEQ